MNHNWAEKHPRFGQGQALTSALTSLGTVSLDLDHWIRMAYWRQWRKPRTKVRNLMKLGVHVQAAVAYGITTKGPWRSSKSPGIQQTLSLAFLKSVGLYALRDGWIKLHYPE
ncbi:hypothetical protein OLMES_4306 [Oleiphilus messinensis]|uniref:Group II intron maturase-specific domain-containing protein n=1 Tax=Oleiphilus messinensis TaxID=141451 RepID=A0A1Y0IFP1_9GAMM|nr:hypothetical protein [Oleiphilus messinensis]ARU58315.1 hypothetical protein OLMES_4306 [Oleiphilus messinensis]